MQIIPPGIRNLWSKEEIRFLVLASLFLQVLLIFLSLFRQRRTSKPLSLLLWSAYLGADYVATLALGNLLNQQNQVIQQKENNYGDLMAFWSPFLLLHLGGPDTITAYSLEDNELWLRHFLGLFLQIFTAVFIFLESLPSPHLWVTAVAVFVLGILKYGERTWSLRSASMNQLRESMISNPDPGPNYAKFMQEYQSRRSAGLEASIKVEKEPYRPLPEMKVETIADKEIIRQAYLFFETFKRLTVDLMLSFQDRTESQAFFLRRLPRQAFQVVEVELSFLHDILHTKAYYVHSLTGWVMRTLSFAMAVLALLLFHHSKHPFNPSDVAITYVLLVAALILETAAIVLSIFSDWTIVALQKTRKPFRHRNLNQIQAAMTRCFQAIAGLILQIRTHVQGPQKWWSNSMRQYNLIDICLKDYATTKTEERFRCLMRTLQLDELLDTCRNVSHVEFSDDAKKLIFQELSAKATSAEGNATSFKRLKACRGEWVLREKGYYDGVMASSVTREFDESILLWHIATYLCYHQMEDEKEKEEEEENILHRLKKKVKKIWGRIMKVKADISERLAKIKKRLMEIKKKIFKRNKSADEEEAYEIGADFDQEEDRQSRMKEEVEVADPKKISKEISDYMMYLVVFQPAMLPAGIGKIRFQDTSAEAKKFFSQKNTEILEKLLEKRPPPDVAPRTGVIKKIYDSIKRSCFSWSKSQISPELKMIEKQLKKDKGLQLEKENLAREMMVKVEAEIDPIEVKGDRSKSVLWDACKLAKQIMGIKKEKIWVIISSVWVEMLCYAASNCSAINHAKQLSQGGELLTHIWLLMAHMGIGEQYRIEAGHARAKLQVKT